MYIYTHCFDKQMIQKNENNDKSCNKYKDEMLCMKNIILTKNENAKFEFINDSNVDFECVIVKMFENNNVNKNIINVMNVNGKKLNSINCNKKYEKENLEKHKNICDVCEKNMANCVDIKHYSNLNTNNLSYNKQKMNTFLSKSILSNNNIINLNEKIKIYVDTCIDDVNHKNDLMQSSHIVNIYYKLIKFMYDLFLKSNDEHKYKYLVLDLISKCYVLLENINKKYYTIYLLMNILKMLYCKCSECHTNTTDDANKCNIDLFFDHFESNFNKLIRRNYAQMDNETLKKIMINCNESNEFKKIHGKKKNTENIVYNDVLSLHNTFNKHCEIGFETLDDTEKNMQKGGSYYKDSIVESKYCKYKLKHLCHNVKKLMAKKKKSNDE